MITVNTGDSPELDAFLAQRIYEYNAAVTGYDDAESFAATHRGEGGSIDAGISGYTWGGCCYISYLWVSQALRGIGIGSELLEAAERHAIALAGIAITARADDPRLITRAAQTMILSELKTPGAGSKSSDVTIVEWFDYDCPFCRKTHPHLQEALRTDPKIRIVYKEWPVFGEVSEYAAQSALAASWQGKYLLAHDALISTPDAIADVAHVDSTLKVAGIDMGQLSRDRKTHAEEIAAVLARSTEEATRLGLKGTPGFLIGRQFVSRSLDLPQLRQLIAYARAPE